MILFLFCISPTINMVEHIFFWLIIWTFSFVNYLFKSFVHFSNGLFVFFLLMLTVEFVTDYYFSSHCLRQKCPKQCWIIMTLGISWLFNGIGSNICLIIKIRGSIRLNSLSYLSSFILHFMLSISLTMAVPLSNILFPHVN